MKQIQQWFTAASLAAIGVFVVYIILSATSTTATDTTVTLEFSNDTAGQQILISPFPTTAPVQTLAPAATIAPPQTLRHVVESGQTLSIIAGFYCIDWQDIQSANGLSDPNALDVGQELTIPRNDC